MLQACLDHPVKVQASGPCLSGTSLIVFLLQEIVLEWPTAQGVI